VTRRKVRADAQKTIADLSRDGSSAARSKASSSGGPADPARAAVRSAMAGGPKSR
jgi:hypothetical protein